MQRILTKREKVILFLAAGLIGFSAVFNFLLLPVLRKNDALNKEVRITRSRLAKYLHLLSQKEDIQIKAGELSAGLDLSGQQKDALAVILSELEGLAKNADIRLVDVRPKAGRGKEVTVDIKTEGDMQGYLKFIYSLENSLTLLTVSKFRISAKANSQYLEGNFSVSQISTDK